MKMDQNNMLPFKGLFLGLLIRKLCFLSFLLLSVNSAALDDIGNYADTNGDIFTRFHSGTARPGIVLSDENLTVSKTHASTSQEVFEVFSESSISSGKHYWELKVMCGPDSLGVNAGFRRPQDSLILGRFPAWGVMSDGYRSSESFLVFGDSFEPTLAGDTFSFAVDLDEGNVFIGKNGVWANGGDPAKGKNPAYSGISGPLLASVNIGSRECEPLSIVANFGNKDFSFDVPEGYFRGFCPTGQCAISGSNNTLTSVFDIDGNGNVDALTDSLLIMRYTFGFSGDELTNDAVGEGATRTSSAEIEAYLEALIPEL